MRIASRSAFIFLLLTVGSFCGAKKRPSAGILPYYVDKSGQAYFLIGQEPNGVWADFGGRADAEDRDPKETALRECTEETRCVFGMYDYKQNRKLRKKILHYPECMQASYRYLRPRMSNGLRHPRGYYVMYLARVEFIEAEVFNRAAKIPHYEKKQYAWVPAKAFIDTIVAADDRNNTHFEGKKVRPPFFDMIKRHAASVRGMVHPRRQVVLMHGGDNSTPYAIS